MPGETISSTITRAAASSTGSLSQAKVIQFTTTVGGTGRGDFYGNQILAVNGMPESVVLADLDGDGDLDMLASEQNQALVFTRFNDGAGHFSGTQFASVSELINSIAVGDLDGDGDIDLLAANAGGTVNIRFNNGRGVFSGLQNVAVGRRPNKVVVGDLDGDGDLDLLTVNSDSDDISVRFNDGNGVFSGTSDIRTLNREPLGIAVGDVDGDGDLDLVTAAVGSGGEVGVLLNDGSGIFRYHSNTSLSSAATPTGTDPASILLADIDGDGDLDFLTANSRVGTVSVGLNTGQLVPISSLFARGPDIVVGYGPYRLAVGDLDSDGDLDLIATHNWTNELSYCYNNGNGVFSPDDVGSRRDCSPDVALGDVDNDGDLDLVCATEQQRYMLVLLNGGTGPLAISRGVEQPQLTLAPNPSRGVVSITGLAPGKSVRVLNALGREISATVVSNSGTAKLSLPLGLAAGIYLVQSGSQTARLAVE